MLDKKYLRNNFLKVKEKLQHRGENLSELEHFEELDEHRLELIAKVEKLKAKRNEFSEYISQLKKANEDTDNIIVEMREIGEEITTLDYSLKQTNNQLEHIMLSIPNIPHDSVPIGKGENDNVEIRKWGKIPSFDFEPQTHWDIGTSLGILDFERASKVTGSRFVFNIGLGARLERALLNFMMDLHADEHEYEEMLPPYIVNSDSLTGTGQLPKFSKDVFKIADSDYYLIPTSEVPVTNFYRNEILSEEILPKQYVVFSACFRSEAGSAGRDTRGLIRQHQFNKVELIHFTKPETSYEILEKLTGHAERVLQLLNLPYRVMNMCTGDLGFTAAKKYDIEVWIPTQKTYREISSCSNFEDFQARRANIRFRRDSNSQIKSEYVHTLNGSGLAIGRTIAAILENYQQVDGSIVVPEVLRPYMGGKDRIN